MIYLNFKTYMRNYLFLCKESVKRYILEKFSQQESVSSRVILIKLDRARRYVSTNGVMGFAQLVCSYFNII